MSQSCLSSLALIPIENKPAQKIDLDKIVELVQVTQKSKVNIILNN